MNRNAYLRKFRAFVQKKCSKVSNIRAKKCTFAAKVRAKKCDYGKKRHQTAPCMEAKEKS